MADQMDGEIGVRAAVGDQKTGTRQITLDPLAEFVAKLPFREVESTLPAGFRVGWMEGTVDDEKKIELLVGAGVGSRWGIIEYDGKSYVFDAQDLLKAVVEAITDDAG